MGPVIAAEDRRTPLRNRPVPTEPSTISTRLPPTAVSPKERLTHRNGRIEPKRVDSRLPGRVRPTATPMQPSDKAPLRQPRHWAPIRSHALRSARTLLRQRSSRASTTVRLSQRMKPKLKTRQRQKTRSTPRRRMARRIPAATTPMRMQLSDKALRPLHERWAPIPLPAQPSAPIRRLRQRPNKSLSINRAIHRRYPTPREQPRGVFLEAAVKRVSALLLCLPRRPHGSHPVGPPYTPA